ncbi:hypothetical protein Tco_0649660 [Tanacetum coccineum]
MVGMADESKHESNVLENDVVIGFGVNESNNEGLKGISEAVLQRKTKEATRAIEKLKEFFESRKVLDFKAGTKFRIRANTICEGLTSEDNYRYDAAGGCNTVKVGSGAGRKFVKRKLSDMSESQRCESSDEASSRSSSGDSDTYPNGDTLTVKAEYGDDLIAFHIPASSETLAALKKETWGGLSLNNVNIGLTWKDTIANLNLSDIVDEQISGAPS